MLATCPGGLGTQNQQDGSEHRPNTHKPRHRLHRSSEHPNIGVNQHRKTKHPEHQSKKHLHAHNLQVSIDCPNVTSVHGLRNSVTVRGLPGNRLHQGSNRSIFVKQAVDEPWHNAKFRPKRI